MSSFFLFPHLAKDTDIVDEAIYYFKANVFFKNYEIKVRDGGWCAWACTESIEESRKMYLRALTRILT